MHDAFNGKGAIQIAGKQRRRRLAQQIGPFLRQYERRSHPGWDTNDRGYDRKVEQRIKRMDPVELDALLRGEEDDADEGTVASDHG